MGVVANEDLATIRAEVDATGEGIVDSLLARKLITPADVTRAKAAQFGA